MNGHFGSDIEVTNSVNGGSRVPQSNGFTDHIVVEDDLSNVCVKDLVSKIREQLFEYNYVC